MSIAAPRFFFFFLSAPFFFFPDAGCATTRVENETRERGLQGGFIMQRHSGRDRVGVLRHTEEQECVGTGRDRQSSSSSSSSSSSGSSSSSAECGVKKKKKKPLQHICGRATFTAHVQLSHPSIFRPSLDKNSGRPVCIRYPVRTQRGQEACEGPHASPSTACKRHGDFWCF